jgi:transposase InsO family protein
LHAHLPVKAIDSFWVHRPALSTKQDSNQSLDFVSDTLIDGRRFRILCVIDDFSRQCLATAVDNSISGERVALELDIIAEHRGNAAYTGWPSPIGVMML